MRTHWTCSRVSRTAWIPTSLSKLSSSTAKDTRTLCDGIQRPAPGPPPPGGAPS